MSFWINQTDKVVRRINKVKDSCLALFNDEFNESICKILMYHQIIDKKDKNLGPYSSNSISINHFEHHLKELKRNYNVISLEELKYCLENNNNSDLPNNSVVITFDDGYKDNLTNALPLLKKYNLPATVYITTGFIDNKTVPFEYKLADILKERANIEFSVAGTRFSYDLNSLAQMKKAYSELKDYGKNYNHYRQTLFLQLISDFEMQKNIDYNLFMDWQEVKQISQEPLITIGAHTHTHPVLSALSIEEVRQEILVSKSSLEKKLDVNITHFAYPYGAVNWKIVNQLNNFNFGTAVTTEADFVRRKHSNYMLTLPRFEASTNSLKRSFA